MMIVGDKIDGPDSITEPVRAVLISAALARLNGGERLHQPGAVALGHQCGGCHRCAARLVGAPVRASLGCGGSSRSA
jgi:hypothetical protein